MADKAKIQLKAHCVLIVEDNAVIGALYIDLLEEMGHAVCAMVATEADAVAAAAIYKPDLMIVDAALREGTGVSAVEEILRAGFVPHIFVSGNVASVQALRPGAIVMQKPFRGLDLARAIQGALNASRTR